MMQPAALLFYENLLIGNQLLNRLQDLGYRVVAVGDLTKLGELAVQEKPIVCFAELGALADRVLTAIRGLRAAPATEHLPVIALFNPSGKRADRELEDQARAAGATLVANIEGIQGQVPQLLEQALEVK